VGQDQTPSEQGVPPVWAREVAGDPATLPATLRLSFRLSCPPSSGKGRALRDASLVVPGPTGRLPEQSVNLSGDAAP